MSLTITQIGASELSQYAAISIAIYGYAGSPAVQHETMLLWYLNL